jgi:hypothetical protein
MKLHSDLSCFFIFLDYILDRTGNLADSYVPICRDKEQQSSVPEQNLNHHGHVFQLRIFRGS